jgi:hypothetical protein
MRVDMGFEENLMCHESLALEDVYVEVEVAFVITFVKALFLVKIFDALILVIKDTYFGLVKYFC